MEQETKRKFYSLAKYPNLEILMESQLNSAGANQAKLLERYKKNKKSVKQQLFVLKIVYGFIFVFLPAITIFAYLNISEEHPSAPMETILFIYAFMFGFFFIISILYVLLMGLFSTSAFMSGSAFKWLQTLPFSKKELRKLGYVTVFRNMDVAIIAMIFGFPIILFIMFQNIVLFFVCFLSSAINAIIGFSILIIVAQKMANVFSESKVNSKKSYLLRIISMGGLFILAFGTSLIIMLLFSSIDMFFLIFPSNQSAILVNRILSLIPFPFGISYIISFILTPGIIPVDIIFTSMIGFFLSIGLAYLLYKVAIKQIRSATQSEIEKKEKPKKKELIKKEISVEIKTISKTKSFIRKDLIATTRDYQSFIFLIIPIIYPVILILGFTGLISEVVSSMDSIIILWSVVVAVNQFIPFMLVAGFLNMEESGATILCSLPLLSREQARAKIYLMLTIQAIGLGLMGIVLMLMTQSLLLLTFFLLTIPIAWILLIATFEIKVRLFGRMKYKYVIEEVNKERKILKWVGIVGSELLIYFGIIIIEFTLLAIYGILGMLIGLVVIAVVGLSILYYVFSMMFPKEREVATYLTGGLLRRNVLAGAFVIMVLYFLFQQLIGFIELPILPILTGLPTEFYYLIEVALVFIVFSVLFFVVIPLGMKLPNGKETIKQYSRTIGLTKFKPIGTNILILILSLILFSVPTIVFTLLGVVSIHLRILFSYPVWVLFYYMLIPGFWEELTFRGVILRLELRKFSKLTSVILNGILFGLMHFLNLLGGGNLYSVLSQVFYATCLGVAFAYIYVKTGSLFITMILHYSVNLFVQVVVFNIPSITIVSFYLTFGLGLIPMILILVMVTIVDLIRKAIIKKNTIK